MRSASKFQQASGMLDALEQKLDRLIGSSREDRASFVREQYLSQNNRLREAIRRVADKIAMARQQNIRKETDPAKRLEEEVASLEAEVASLKQEVNGKRPTPRPSRPPVPALPRRRRLSRCDYLRRLVGLSREAMSLELRVAREISERKSSSAKKRL